MRKALLRFCNFGLFIPLWIVLCISSCDKSKEKISNSFSDSTRIKIAEFQDKRLTDSLYFINDISSKLNGYRVLAFGSIQDTTASRYLEGILYDSVGGIRNAAAFSLSQMSNGSAAVLRDLKSVVAADSTTYLYLGKFLISNGSYSDADFATIPWAYYRHGLTSRVGTVEAMKVNRFLFHRSVYARLGAAHFFARSNALDTITGDARTTVVRSLMKAAESDSAEVRMAAVFALRKENTDSVLRFLSGRVRNDPDYRVRVNAVRAAEKFPFKKSKEMFKVALGDENANVAVAASEIILSSITKGQWVEISAIARKTGDARVRANLYEAALKVSNNKELSEEMVRAARKATKPYDKAALITALRHSLMQFEFIADQLMQADTPVVRTAAATALVDMDFREKLEPALKTRFAEIYSKAIQGGDVGVIGTVAMALADSTLGYRNYITDIAFLRDARTKLIVPRDAEALQALDAAIGYFEKTKPLPYAPVYNHPIDWDFVKRIPADQKIIVTTSRGDITIRLFVDEAPGTVANFVKLISSGYFNNKFFHRVVPNFVVQGGCPRGDGWGGENYTIRSEFTPRRFTTGSVGMASSGKDTEGTQWFITHSPTPHLEGRYTNFGEVTDGMEIVHKLEVGDRILEVRLK